MFEDDWWFPDNITFSDVPTEASDLWVPVWLAVPFVLVRIVWEACVGLPIGWLLGYFGNVALMPLVVNHLFGGFAQNTRSKRVLESWWRFSYYLIAFLGGVWVMYDKEWLFDVKQCWIGWPFHQVDTAVWWYYMLETGFYYSLLIGSLFDVRRHDFWQMVVHHIVTIGLLSVSFANNFTRVGTLVLISHDVADVFLEGGKLVRYDMNQKNATNVIFVLFMASWLVTRCGYFPLVVIRSATFEAASLIKPDYSMVDLFQAPYIPRLIIILLVALQCLHFFWTWIIAKIVVKTLRDGEAADVRSDSEGEEERQPETERNKLLRKRIHKVD